MFIRQFEYILALARTEHFGRAATECHVSQSGLSNAIRQLEDELGTAIVLRDHRFQGFTAEGERIVEWARRFIGDIDMMRQELSLMKGNLTGQLRIGAMPSCSPILPFITSALTQRYPLVTVSICFLGIDELRRKVLNFELDLGIGYLNLVDSPQIAMRLLYSDDMALLVPSKPDSQKKMSATWKEAAELPLCLLPRSMEERRIVDAVFAAEGLDVIPRIEADSFVNLAFHVMHGHYSTIIAGHFRYVSGAFPGTRILRLVSPAIQQQIGLFWLESEPALPLIHAVINTLDRLTEEQTPWLSRPKTRGK
jgi:DNA-binding transcriptional LysR family regulator